MIIDISFITNAIPWKVKGSILSSAYLIGSPANHRSLKQIAQGSRHLLLIFVVYTDIMLEEWGAKTRRGSQTLWGKVQKCFCSPFSHWSIHGKVEMAALVYFRWIGRDRQNLSLGISLSLFTFQGHILAKNPLSVFMVLTDYFFFSSTSGDVIISLLSLWRIKLSHPFKRQPSWLFIVKLSYQN